MGMLISNWELISIFKVLPKLFLYIFVCVYLKLENYDCMIVLLLQLTLQLQTPTHFIEWVKTAYPFLQMSFTNNLLLSPKYYFHLH